MCVCVCVCVYTYQSDIRCCTLVLGRRELSDRQRPLQQSLKFLIRAVDFIVFSHFCGPPFLSVPTQSYPGVTRVVVFVVRFGPGSLRRGEKGRREEGEEERGERGRMLCG